MRDKKKHKNRKSGREKGETYFEEIENINKRVNWGKKRHLQRDSYSRRKIAGNFDKNLEKKNLLGEREKNKFSRMNKVLWGYFITAPYLMECPNKDKY